MAKISLTEKENQIFDFLMGAVKHFELDVQMRVAGGWVRDKVMYQACLKVPLLFDLNLNSSSWAKKAMISISRSTL